MGEMMLLIYYGGELSDGNYKVGMVLSDDNYKGNTVMVFVPYDLTYNDLIKTINHNVKVDLSKFSIELRAVLICTSGKRVTVKLENDSDVTVLIREDKLIPEVYVITEMRDDGIAAQNDQIEVVVEKPIDHEVEEETRKREEEKTRKRKRQLELYRAAVKGDWGVAEHIFKNHREDIESIISKEGDTVLHIATAASHTHFVRQLVENDDIDLTAKNKRQNTAFCLAATTGNMELIKLMMEKENTIAEIRAKNKLPVQIAAMYGHEKTVIHLYNATRYKLSDRDRIELLVTLIENSLYDAAFLLLDEHPDLATLRAGNGETALHVLARKPLTLSDLHNPNQQGILKNFFNLFLGISMVHKIKMDPKARKLVELLWEKIILLDDYKIAELIRSPSRPIFDAAEQGNDELLSILIRSYPDLIYLRNKKNGYTLIHVAVLYRNERVFNLIYQSGSIKDLMLVVDENKDNILHLAAKLPPPHLLNLVSGAALQLQRELLWFEELSDVVTQLIAEAKNKDGLTPKDLFTREHEKLLVKGEEWMKRTAESCMLVSTLIATVVFAAAITVPGGIKEDRGAPHFLKKPAFMIFAISDTISLVSSCCSILTFLSIFTARYAVEDFLRSLPKKLVLGVWTLFVSIVAMMVVFCATMFIIFYDGMIWPFVLAVALGSFPVFMFIYQQNHILHLIHFSRILEKGTHLRILPRATRKSGPALDMQRKSFSGRCLTSCFGGS